MRQLTCTEFKVHFYNFSFCPEPHDLLHSHLFMSGRFYSLSTLWLVTVCSPATTLLAWLSLLTQLTSPFQPIPLEIESTVVKEKTATEQLFRSLLYLQRQPIFPTVLILTYLKGTYQLRHLIVFYNMYCKNQCAKLWTFFFY
jgi:hypothetical protein